MNREARPVPESLVLAGCDELFSVLAVSLEGLVGVFGEVFDDGVAEVVGDVE